MSRINQVSSHGGLVLAIQMTLQTLLSGYSNAQLDKIEVTDVLLCIRAYLLHLANWIGLKSFLHNLHSINFTRSFIWLAYGRMVLTDSKIAGSQVHALTNSHRASATFVSESTRAALSIS